MGALLIFGAISAAIFFVIAEVFGRAKHIGRWWSFFLLWGCFILPGVIAIVFSPSAKKEPTKPNNLILYSGVVIFSVFGLLGFLPAGDSMDPLAFSIPIGFIILGLYLVQLGAGKVRNSNPKFYLEKVVNKTSGSVKDSFNKIGSSAKSPLQTSETEYYFVEVNGEQKGPLTFEELRSMRISENQKVWRHGLNKWVKANELPELRGSIVYTPPPIHPEHLDNDIEEVEDKDSEETENHSYDITNDIGESDNKNIGVSQKVSDIKERYWRKADKVLNDIMAWSTTEETKEAVYRTPLTVEQGHDGMKSSLDTQNIVEVNNYELVDGHEMFDKLKRFRTFYFTILILGSIFLNGSLIGLFVSYYNGLDCTILLSLLAIFINYQAYSIWYVWYRSKVNSWLTLWPLIKPSVAILSISVLVFVIIFQIYYSLQFLFYVIQVG